PTPPPLPP
nr:Chain P, Formin-1 [Mus musculus]